MLQHQFSEIKRHPQKTYCPVTQLQKLNRALAEIINFDGSDDYMYTYLVNRYHQSLDLSPLHGRSASLVPQAVQ